MPKSEQKIAVNRNRIPPVNHPDSYRRNYPASLGVCPERQPKSLCVKGFPLQEKGAAAKPPLDKTRYCYCLPAAAPAAAGIIPAIAIPSIRATTFSTLAPVSVQAST